MSDSPDKEVIADHDKLNRWIRHNRYDRRRLRATKAAYLKHLMPEKQPSVSLDRLLGVEDFYHLGDPDNAIGQVVARDVRELGLDPIHDPVTHPPMNLAHCVICCLYTENQCYDLAERTIIVRPSRKETTRLQEH